MNNHRMAVLMFSLLCCTMMFCLIVVAFQPRAEMTVVSGEALVHFKEFTYRVKEGETFLDVHAGDSKLTARIRTKDGTIRFQPPEERLNK